MYCYTTIVFSAYLIFIITGAPFKVSIARNFRETTHQQALLMHVDDSHVRGRVNLLFHNLVCY